jgi:signal transduction histidine kinase
VPELQRSRELASLLKVSQALGSTLDLATVLQTTTDSATGLFGIESAAIYLLQGQELYLGATTPPLPPAFPEALRSAPLSEHPHIAESIAKGRPVVLADTATEALTPSERAVVKARNLRTVFYVPILVENRATGVLILGSVGRPRAIPPAQVDLARTAANLIAVSIQNAVLHAKEVKQAETLRAEFETNQALTDLSAALVESGSSLESIARVVLEKARLLTRSEHGYVASIDPRSQNLVVHAFTGMLGREGSVPESSPVFPVGPDGRYGALWGHSLNTRRGFFTDSPQTHESATGTQARVSLRNFLSVPAIVADRLVGQIGLANSPAGYGEDTLALVERLAKLLALAVERSRNEAALRDAERMTAMGSLVGSVAHEVRNPLFALSATLDAFEACHDSGDSPAEYLKHLREQVERLSQLMQELLEYGRPQQLVLERQGLPPLVRHAVESARYGAEPREVSLAVDLPEGLPMVDADAGRLRRVFQNLIDNAVQHSPTGGTVRIEVSETTRGHDRRLCCVVRDQGPGFAASEIPKLFEPFFTKRKGGTGLGLAIAWKIVEEHHGTLTAANAPDGGAVLTVTLPVGEDAGASTPA